MPFSGVLVDKAINKDNKVLIELSPYKYDEIKIHRHHFYLERKNTPDIFETYNETIEQIRSAAEICSSETPKVG
ncbi:MAG TPA: hypothetical protein G4N92_02865 [Anaerolineae bacterium]|nr:hypothetical protein [Anaerolineae bacterium]